VVLACDGEVDSKGGYGTGLAGSAPGDNRQFFYGCEGFMFPPCVSRELGSLDIGQGFPICGKK
jgi:hypothetical protein